MTLAIRRREQWGARYSDGAGPAPLPALSGCFLHHSDGPARNGDSVIRDLEQVGQDRFGAGISYTFPVTPDGQVYEGHSIDRRGSHTKGYNTSGRAIVLCGDYTATDPTPEQLESVAVILAEGVRRGWWLTTRIRPHRSVRATACPGDRAVAHIPGIIARADELLRVGPTPPRPPDPPGGDDMTPEDRKLLQAAYDEAHAANLRAAHAVAILQGKGYDPRTPGADNPTRGSMLARILGGTFRNDRALEAEAQGAKVTLDAADTDAGVAALGAMVDDLPDPD